MSLSLEISSDFVQSSGRSEAAVLLSGHQIETGACKIGLFFFSVIECSLKPRGKLLLPDDKEFMSVTV